VKETTNPFCLVDADEEELLSSNQPKGKRTLQPDSTKKQLFANAKPNKELQESSIAETTVNFQAKDSQMQNQISKAVKAHQDFEYINMCHI
jgi:DhnA family fructose-bisphosphate aldolase class Ia